MARRRKQKDSIVELIGSGIVLLSLYFYSKSNSWTVALIIFISLTLLLLLSAYVISSIKNQKLLKSGITRVDQMTGIEFENYLSVLFRKLGFETAITKSSGDYGADLILNKDGKKIVVQAKRYKKNVGIKAVQEISSAKLHYGGHEAWVVTNSGYTTAARELARTNHVKLFQSEDLIKWGLLVASQNSSVNR